MKTLLGFVLVCSALTLVLTPASEGAWRRRRNYSTVPAATATTAQTEGAYRTYSYEPGSSGSTYRSSRPVDRSFRDATFKASGRQN